MIPELRNTHDGVIDVCPRVLKSLQDQGLKLQVGIHIYLESHMEAMLLAINIRGKCGMLWYQLATEIEVFQLKLVTKTYRESEMAAGKVECCKVVLTMVRVIWYDTRKL